MRNLTSIFVAALFASLFSLNAAADSLEELMDESLSLVSVGFEMAEYSTDDVGQCMDMMREHQPKVDGLRSRIAALPYSVSQSNLDMSAIDLRRCLSCVPDAVSSCEAAETLVDTAEQYLN